jgi:hypothetical protein
VITRKLAPQDKGERRQIHEGLADYLVYAATGDTCLGESVKADCGLRPTEGNDKWAAVGKSDYENGTALALTLWKLRTDLNIDPEKFDAMVFMTIDGLRLQSGFTDLIKSLLIANHAVNSGVGACKILNAFMASGFDSFAQGISCQEYGS